MSKKRFIEDSYRKEPWFRALCSAFASCKTEEEIADFLRDVATLSELQAFSERLEVAKQLSQGKTYRDIAENTGASTTTVTRVAKFLENGSGGYRRVLNTHRHHRMAPQVMSDTHRRMPPPGEGASPPSDIVHDKSALQKALERAKK